MAVVSVGRGGRRAGLRPPLLGGLLAIAIVMGLLTMCTSNAASASHGATTTHAVAQHDGHVAGAQHAADPVVADSIRPDHAMAMACVMALLAFVVLLSLPRGFRHRLAGRIRSGPRLALGAIAERTRPSLLVLCISRT